MAPVGYALNSLHVIILFLAWVGTCVSFGGVLFTASTKPVAGVSASLNFYYDHVTGPNGFSSTYSNDNFPIKINGVDKCTSGGRGFVAMQVFSFLPLLAALFIVILRLLGKHSVIPQLQSATAALRAELFLTGVATFFYFLAVCIWGGTCFQKAKDADGLENVMATGYAFVIVDFFFLMLDLILLLVILKNPAFQLGAESEAKHEQHTDQPQVNSVPDQYNQTAPTHGDPNLVELTCPACAAKVTCPRGGQTNCAVCDAEIAA